MFNWQVYCLYADDRGFKILWIQAATQAAAEAKVCRQNLISMETQYCGVAD